MSPGSEKFDETISPPRVGARVGALTILAAIPSGRGFVLRLRCDCGVETLSHPDGATIRRGSCGRCVRAARYLSLARHWSTRSFQPAIGACPRCGRCGRYGIWCRCEGSGLDGCGGQR